MASAFENLAPRVIGDLIRDLHLTAEQASGPAGNAAAESGFEAINERRPLVPGSRGGFGWFQLTGPRRVAFERWAKAKGLDPTSYAAQYGYLLEELRTTESNTLTHLRLCKTAKAAAETFGYYFERFAGYQRIAGNPNYARRVRFAERALALYQASLKEPTVPTPLPVPLPVPLPEPQQPIQTKRIQGLGLVVLGLFWSMFARKWFPAFESQGLNVIADNGGEIVAAFGALWSWIGQRNASTAIAGTPLAKAINAARNSAVQAATDTQTQSDRADAAEAIPAAPQSLFDLPMSVVLDELPALLRAISNVAVEQPKLLEHRPGPEVPS
jgi:hypothetical protein